MDMTTLFEMLVNQSKAWLKARPARVVRTQPLCGAPGEKPEASTASSAHRCINSPASLIVLLGGVAESSPQPSPPGMLKSCTRAWSALSRTARSGNASVRMPARCLSKRARALHIHAGALMLDCSGSMDPRRNKSGLSTDCNFADNVMQTCEQDAHTR